MIVFVVVLVAVAGIDVYGYMRMRSNASSSGSSVSGASSTASGGETVAGGSSEPGTGSAAASSSSKTDSEQTSALPASWNDSGIFSAYYAKAYQKLSTMSLSEKVGQMFLARCPQENAVSSIQACHLGGFVLFESDFKGKNTNQVVSTIAAYQKASSIPMIMAVDEEGGTVVRISGNPKLSAHKFQSPQQVYAEGGLKAVSADTLKKAQLLKKLGLNLNLAPVSDVSLSPSDYIYSRTLGRSAQATGQYVAAVVKAMRESGLSSTLKHFPGYGNNLNTHTGIAIDNRPYSTFVNSDFIPFEQGIKAGAESILVSHNIVQCMQKGVPASLSPAVHRILRNDLHFTGVIMTDDLSMGAIKDYTDNQDPAVAAVLAGNDMLMTDDFQQGYDAVLKAVNAGVISKEQIDRAVFRILAWKYARRILV